MVCRENVGLSANGGRISFFVDVPVEPWTGSKGRKVHNSGDGNGEADEALGGSRHAQGRRIPAPVAGEEERDGTFGLGSVRRRDVSHPATR